MSKILDLIKTILGSNAPSCKICHRYSEETLCKSCDEGIKNSAPNEKTRDVSGITVHFPYSYTRYVRYILKKFKFEDKPNYGEILASYMGEVFSSLEYDVITFVPLHEKRLSKRGYNQAQLIAVALDENAKELLVRTRDTTPQYRVPANMRRQNVEGAFEVARGNSVYGKKILVVDDIVTTGSTLMSVAHALKSAGASDVSAIAFASSGDSTISLN